MVARSGDSALGCAGQAPPFLAGHASRPVQVLYSLITVDRGLGHPSIHPSMESVNVWETSRHTAPLRDVLQTGHYGWVTTDKEGRAAIPRLSTLQSFNLVAKPRTAMLTSRIALTSENGLNQEKQSKLLFSMTRK
jgi:hypothetical protein